ncbi:MAG: tetratricopeptide repeat protein [Elusimicrobia bacterium]|jgi:hypothetical protein|nr:tetratricopeptide repeat protein [Elusimicrobiota bacterium]
MKAEEKKEWRNFAVLLLGVGLVYMRSLHNGFLWDDQVVLVANTFIKDWKNIGHLFGSSYFLGSGELSYRPVATASYLMGHLFWGLSRPGFHGLSLLLHLLTGVAVFLFFRRIFEMKGAAFWGAALFLLHPINTEAVLQVSFNEELFCGLFLVLAFYFYVRCLPGESLGNVKMRLYGLSLACYTLSLFSKEMGIVFPLLLLLYESILGKEKNLSRGILRWWPYLGYGLISLFYLWVRFFALRNPKELSVPYIQDSFIVNGLTMAKVFFLYLKQLLWPFHLSPDHHVEVVARVGDPLVVLIFLGFLGGGGVFFWVLRRSRLKAFLSLWVVVGLLPVLNFIPFLKENFMADRYLYLSSMGFSGWVASLGVQEGAWKGKGKTLLLLLLVGFGALTFRRTLDWKDDVRFWGRSVETDPLSVESHNRLGSAYSQRREFDKAMAEYKIALRLNPQSTRALNNMGNVFFSLGQYDSALRVYNQSLAIDPHAAVTYANRGSAWQALGRPVEAIEDYSRALEMKPSFAEVYLNLAVVHEDLHQLEAARKAYQSYLLLRPNSIEVQNRLLSLKTK